MGKKHLGKRVASYRQRFSSSPRGILIIGISGGCKPGLATGDIFRVTRVCSGTSVLTVSDAPCAEFLPFKTACCFTSSKPLKTPGEKESVYREHSSEIVDMESFFLVQSLKNKQTPVRILRVISDQAEDILPEIAMVWGAAPAARVFTTLLKEILHPRRCLALIRFNRGVHRACTRLRRAMSNPACVKFS